MVGQKAASRPAASPGWDAEAALGCEKGWALTDPFKESSLRICQCPTFLTTNLLECFAKSENIEVRHLPLLPCIKRLKQIRRTRSRFPDLQDSSLHSPLQTLDSPRKIHPKIAQ